MTELVEINSGPVITIPALGFHNPTSATPSPHPESIPRTPKSPFSSAARMMTPLASPMKKAIISMQTYLEEVGHLTKLDPQDSWLPITESRNGNAYYAAFHTLSSGIGFQALLLPLAFTTLGCSMNLFLERATADTSGYQWLLLVIIVYIDLVFVCSAVILAQLPNLNSIAGISLVGAITAVTYCTLTWVLSVSKTKPPGVSYEPVWTESEVGNISSVLNALGIIAFAFRGHNLVLEIQGTMPSSAKNPSSVPMWKGVKFSYMIIACCLFPMAVGGYWAYGNLVSSQALKKWRDVERIGCLPQKRYTKNDFGFDKPICRDQQPYFIPDLCHASLRQSGVQIYKQQARAMPLVAEDRDTSTFWLLCLLHLSGSAILEEPGWVDWWNCFTCNSGISMLDVDKD